LNKKQDDFIFCNDLSTCLKGTWGCGKSLAGLYAANRECEENPRNLYLITRNEWVDLRDSTIHDWNEFVGRPINGDKNVIYPNGSVLMFRHGADLNALKNSNLGGALMVQAEEESEDTFWFLKGRLRRKEGTRQLRLECNYDGHNWIYKLFNEQKIGTLITTNTFDNEKNLPADYIPSLKKLPKRLQERHLYGSDTDMEGRVFDEFDLSKHIINPFEVPKEWNKIISLDHGVTNPTAVLWICIDQDGNLFVYDEHYEAGKTVSYHAEQIKKRLNDNVIKWLGDPSCNSRTREKNGQLYSVFDEYKDNGINFFPADNALLAGINRVNEYFKSGKLKIFKNCENTIREVENWKWKKLKPGLERNQPEEPEDKNDHACDALRYAVMSRPKPTVIDRSEPINPNSPFGQYLLKEHSKDDFVYSH
jgi:phage terminase large subunit